ncbi:hypothetical protein WN943_025218 [Citrus x changshan-huyou]
MKLQILKNEFGSQSHNTKEKARVRSDWRLQPRQQMAAAHGSRWQQLTAADGNSSRHRSRQQMAAQIAATDGSRLRHRSWQQIACLVSVSAADLVSAESDFRPLVSTALTADWFCVPDRVAITTRSDPNPIFFGSDRVGSDRIGYHQVKTEVEKSSAAILIVDEMEAAKIGSITSRRLGATT